MTGWLLTVLVALAPSATKDDGEDAPRAVRAAIEKALPLIVMSTAEYPKHRDCFSCHHQAVPVLALATARGRGFAVAPDAIAGPVEIAEADLKGALEGYKKGQGQGGGVTRAGYAMFTLEVGGRAADEVTDAVAGFLLERDKAHRGWRSSSKRPPSEASEFTATYLALRALAAFGTAGQKERIAERTVRARDWLESAEVKDTEDRAFRLLALKAADAPEGSIRKASDDLLATRRRDGGWSQLDDGGESDAYATGTALVALHRAGGLATDDPVYREALTFLIGSQRPDGSWFVASRSKPFQPYFESGFPYGKDQFISMAATSWAVTALALACPEPEPKRPTLFVIGDSTVNNRGGGLLGWGGPIADHFDATKVRVDNRARGGRSSRTYRTEGLWDQVLADLKPGDFVLIQFGHNDGGPLSGARARASIKGTGDETREVVDESTGKTEEVHTYGWYIRKYVAEAKAKGATPVVLSPVPRNIWKGEGTVARASNDYGKWAADAAKAEGAAFIDLNDRVARRYEAIGREKVTSSFFPGDHTHTNAAGARLNADEVAAGLRTLDGCPLRAALKPEAGPDE